MRASNTPLERAAPDAVVDSGGDGDSDGDGDGHGNGRGPAPWHALRDVFMLASAFDVDEAPSDLAVRELTARLEVLLDRADGVIRAVQAAAPDPVDELDAMFGADKLVADPETEAVPALAPRSLADACFAAILELGQARRGLGAQTAATERVVAFETTRRRLCQTLIVVLEAAGQRALLGGHAQAEDLSAALRLRSRYAAFRRGLRPAASSSAEDVMTAIRYAAGALAQLVSSTDFAIARAADRAVLRGLRDRMLEWARHDKTSLAGVRILSDVSACADLLQGINRRQELRHHDVALLIALRPGPAGDLPAWIGELRRLDGLDDELDALTARAEAERGAAPTVAAILGRLEVLA